MYLTVYKANYRKQKIAKALSNAGEMHKLLFSEGIKASRIDGEALYRIERSGNDYLVFFKSQNKPLPIDGLDIITQKIMRKDDLPSFGIYKFFIELTPMKSIHGKKHYIIGDSDNGSDPRYTRKLNRMEWVKGQFEKRGMKILSCHEGEVQEKYFSHSEERGGRNGHLTSWKYSGTMEITDHDKFVEAYSKGIGIGKAYGNGMLLLG